MSIISNPSFFYKDANGIRTDYCIGIATGSDPSEKVTGSTARFSYRTATDFLTMAVTSAPTNSEGNLYYDSATHKLKIRGAAGWETITSA